MTVKDGIHRLNWAAHLAEAPFELLWHGQHIIWLVCRETLAHMRWLTPLQSWRATSVTASIIARQLLGFVAITENAGKCLKPIRCHSLDVRFSCPGAREIPRYPPMCASVIVMLACILLFVALSLRISKRRQCQTPLILTAEAVKFIF